MEGLGFEAETLRVKGLRMLGLAYLRDGRICLIKREWGKARRSFGVAMKMGSLTITLGALVGFGLSYARRDLEPMLKLIGIPPLR